MKCRFAISLAVVLISTLSVLGQKDPDTLSERERKEVRSVAKRFVAKLQRTHDVRPLEKEFLLSGREQLLGRESFLMTRMDNLQFAGHLKDRDLRRLILAEANYFFVTAACDMAKQSEKNCFTPWIREVLFGDEWGAGPANVSSRVIASRIERLERALDQAARFMTRTKMTSEPAYVAELARRISDEQDNYKVTTDFIGKAESSMTAAFRAKYPNGVRTFTSTTPVGLQMTFVREKGKFKILLVGPYPWD